MVNKEFIMQNLLAYAVLVAGATAYMWCVVNRDQLLDCVPEGISRESVLRRLAARS